VGAGGGRRRHSRGSRATERPSESGCGGRKGEMRVRVGVWPQARKGGSYRGIRAGSGPCC
jgi:hypothetical protein